MNESDFDVVIVGAGPAGLGCALALQAVGVESLAILESRSVGASFRSWPEEMRLITPSFHPSTATGRRRCVGKPVRGLAESVCGASWVSESWCCALHWLSLF